MTDEILDFVAKRKDSIEQKRRSFERILFQNVLGAYSVVHKDGAIYPIVLVDISKKGCLFEVPWSVKNEIHFDKGAEITLRMYFTEASYIPLVVNIKHSREFYDESRQQLYMRYGCEFDKSTNSFDAMSSFIEFMFKFAEHSVKDNGDIKLMRI